MKSLWIAREWNGTIYLWKEKPQRHIATDEEKMKLYPSDYDGPRIEGWWQEGFDIGEEGAFGELPEEMFPNLKWESDPLEVEIVSKSFMDRWREYSKYEMKALGIEEE